MSHLFESPRRFSQSLIWRMQRRFFEREAMDAWRLGIVPHYVTSNPYLAHAYARLVLAFLEDQRTRFVPGEPIHFVELGSGCGRFTYHFLKQIETLIAESSLRATPWVHVMTDVAEPLIAAWRDQPKLRTYVERGRLDFARFDAAEPAPLVLEHRGTVLAPGTTRNPLIVIANYVFDTAPSDCFAVRGGLLHEGLVAVGASRTGEEPDDPSLLDEATLSVTEEPVAAAPYADAAFNRILDGYRERLHDTRFLFPIAALRSLAYLRGVGHGLLALAADRGVVSEEAFQALNEPVVNKHGSFSLHVNFDALARYARGEGGRVYETSYRVPRLEVVALSFDDPTDDSRFRVEYDRTVERAGPADFFSLKKSVERCYETMTLEELLAHLRFSRWDTNVFWGSYPTLLDHATVAGPAERAEIRAAAERVWDMYYPIGESGDVALLISSLFYVMRDWVDALRFLELSVELKGRRPIALYNAALCHHHLGHREAALARLAEVEATHHDLPAVAALREVLTQSA